MADTPLLLIVCQRPIPHPELEELAGELRKDFQLDPYTARQRLLGPGLVQLAQGERARLEGLAAVLRRYGYACWVVDQHRPPFSPPRLRSLEVGNEAIDFLCEGNVRVRLERGATVVGVLADLSGELAGQQVKRMLARNAYLGREQAAIFSSEEIRQTILKGQPIFDCYQLDDKGTVAGAFRVLPGRFNPEGLGGRASLGAARNLDAVVEMVDEYAGTFRLHTDFGLSQLPGCVPQPARDNPAAVQGNLEALTRYGWLVAGLGEQNPASGGHGENTPGTLLAGGLAGAAGVVGDIEELREAAAAVDQATGSRPSAVAAPTAVFLPSPPERPEQVRFSLRQAVWAAITFFSGTLAVAIGKTEGFHSFFDRALLTGVLPGIVAAACFWGAFSCLRLKRFIEDTPTSRIRSLAMGLVEVQGRAVRRYALVAPMTQAACVWYRLRKYRRDKRNSNWTLTSESDSSHVPFVLDDGTGRVVVDPAGATIKTTTERTDFPGESTLLGTIINGGPEEKWVEDVLYEGTTLYVLGYARPVRGVGPGLPQRTVEVLRRLKLDPRALRRYDTNGDGRLDADEWQAARADAECQAAAEQLSEQGVPSVDNAVLGKPPRGMPFLIAEGQAGAGLAGRYGWIGAALLILSMVAFGLALKFSLAFFRVF